MIQLYNVNENESFMTPKGEEEYVRRSLSNNCTLSVGVLIAPSIVHGSCPSHYHSLRN